MIKNELHFTSFSDETGSITNNKPEIFGGSSFIIEDSEIKECRSFLKQYYPNGIHCREINRKSKIKKITKKIGAFLKNKNCFAITSIQTNKKLIEDYNKKYDNQLTQKDLSLIKRWFYYSMVLRNSIPGLYQLSKDKKSVKKITLNPLIEDFRRNKTIDLWDLHKEVFSSSVEIYKNLNQQIRDFMEKLIIKSPQSKTKEEEIMFSFPDLFAYSVRRMVTHQEHNLYNNLKATFDKAGDRGYCSDSRFFKETPPGIFIFYTTVKELNTLLI